MSTQLILYPQNYKGRYNSTATPLFNEYIVNGISFLGLNGTVIYSTTDNYPSESAIINSPPAVLGNWYRYATTGGPWATVPPPLLNGANVLMFSQPTAAHSGIYQQLSGLAIGASYDVVINIAAPAVGILTVETYSGTVIQYNQPFSSNVAQINGTFTANSTNDIFLLDYESTTGTVEIGDISIQESPTTVTNIFSDLNDGQVICDLYQEEDIPLTLSIDDFKNVVEQVKSYSKNFNLPATKRNNQIFNNMFEVTRADDGVIFNPYIKTQCILKQDGFILFEGYLRLIDVKDKEGEISYNVNLYSDVVALADTLKDKTFADLDFTELEHDYNKDSIKQSWNDGLWQDIGLPLINTINSNSFAYDASLNNPTTHTSVLKYPFIDWTHEFLIGGTGTGNNATAGNPELTTLETAFRPCIQLKYLINKIFADSSFTWTSTFFDSADFGKLYMDFNWGSGNSPVDFDTIGSSQSQAADAYNYAPNGSWGNVLFLHEIPWWPWSTNSGYNILTGVFTTLTDNTVYDVGSVVRVQWQGGATPTTVLIEWVSVDAITGAETIHLSDSHSKVAFSGTSATINLNINVTLNAGDTLYCRFQADATNNVRQYTDSTGSGSLLWANVSNDVFTPATLLQTLRGELGQWDFLKGIMTMFNLVSLVDETDPDNILIEPYSDVYINNTNGGVGNLTLKDRGIQHDWTEKIDVSQMELKPLTDLNKITVFQFVEDEDDYVFSQYKNSTSGHLYGSKVHDASGFTILDGEKEIIAEPFAATVSKPLWDNLSQFITPAIYSMTDDGTSEGFDNSPRIFYDNGVKDTGASYYIPEQNDLSSENQTNFLQFSHLTDIPTIAGSRDFVFESQQLFEPISIPNGPPTDNLFSIYWQPYFNELYNADTRTMTLKVNLSPTDISNFKFYDTVFIKNRTFRVNKIQYKPNDLATVEFILIP